MSSRNCMSNCGQRITNLGRLFQTTGYSQPQICCMFTIILAYIILDYQITTIYQHYTVHRCQPPGTVTAPEPYPAQMMLFNFNFLKNLIGKQVAQNNIFVWPRQKSVTASVRQSDVDLAYSYSARYSLLDFIFTKAMNLDPFYMHHLLCMGVVLLSNVSNIAIT